MAQPRSDHEPGERYAVLRIISVIYTGTGAFFLVLGSLLLAYWLSRFLAGPTVVVPPRDGPPFATGPRGVVTLLKDLNAFLILWALGFLGAGLQSLAMGSLFRLAIHAEENTRTTARCLEKLCTRLEPRVENPGPFFVS